MFHSITLCGICLLLTATFALEGTACPALGSQADAASRYVEDTTQEAWELRRTAALRVYETRLGEFKEGRSSANVVLQSSARLLHVSLATRAPAAVIDYARRSSVIEAIARKNLQLGTGTSQEVAQAVAAKFQSLCWLACTQP